MRGFLASVLFGLFVTGAHASGGASCNNDGGAATIEINVGITRGMGGPIFSLAGAVDATADVADDLRKISFERGNAAQYWLDGEEFRLLLYRERGADKEHGYTQLEIRAKAVPDDESTYAGTYILSFWDTAGGGDAKEAELEGVITCFVE